MSLSKEILDVFPPSLVRPHVVSVLQIFAGARAPEDAEVRAFIARATCMGAKLPLKPSAALAALEALMASAPAPLAYVVDTNTLERQSPRQGERREAAPRRRR